MLAAVDSTGLPRRIPPGGTGAGRNGTDEAEVELAVDVRGVDDGRCTMLLHTTQLSYPAASFFY